MKKVNFLKIYSKDTSTEKQREIISKNLETISRDILENSGSILALLKREHPEIQLHWSYKPSEVQDGKITS
ncbi:hypothetical protein DGMP_06320 [Desulfomarina profundi]|uniref:Uncharacterized protein n=1 Tax=Desulfomarina profundi TaxID=2772557 RepID=A0A8D5FKM9_9BACT|nr:hypothetical protein [Desulfomarina profundi]BCL59939.1 hypothetical protein DGMP_06320 [Desulfomarina profundi]